MLQSGRSQRALSNQAKSIASASWPVTRAFRHSRPAEPLLDGLREGGFIEGKNIIIERRFSEGRLNRYSELVEELVRLQVNVLVTSANEATLAAKRANTKLPVVMMNVTDPLGYGIVASLAHPEGNITGLVQDDSAEIAAKRMQLLKDAVPYVAHLAILMDPDLQDQQAQWQQLERAALSLNVRTQAACGAAIE